MKLIHLNLLNITSEIWRSLLQHGIWTWLVETWFTVTP